MNSNPFANESAWDVSEGGGILSAGDHVVTIREVENDGNSSGGHPQLVVKAGNESGEIRDWIVVIPRTIGKVVQLTDAAGLSRPDDSQVVPEGTGYRLDASYVNQLVGKEVGCIVRSEPDRMDPTRTRDRVKGWVSKDKISPDLGGNPPVGAAAAFQGAADDDLPF